MFKTLAIVATLATAAFAGGVIKLTKRNFDAIALDKSKQTFVKFFAPWSGHCKKVAPEWKQLAEENELANVNIAEIDCDADDSRSLCLKYNARTFPAFKLFKNGEPVMYFSARKLDDFKDFLKEHA